MRALRLDNGKLVLDAGAPEPTPGPGEALVRCTLVGVSALDVAIARRADPGVNIMGHEFVGVVERVEPDAQGRSRGDALVGQRVVGSPDVLCGKCDMCRSGLSSHCRERALLGGPGRDGCFAERLAVPVRNLWPAPQAVPDDAAVFAHALSRALQAAQRIHVEGRPFITVLGEAAAALLTVQVMSRLNASVRLVAESETALAACEKLGVKGRSLNDVGRRADQDAVVDCVGSEASLTLAMKMVRPRGTIVMQGRRVGASDAAGRVDLTPVFEHELELIGSRWGSMADAVAALERGDVQTEGLITRRTKLGVEALQAAAERGQIKVVMDV